MKTRVMIVEDAPSMCYMLKKILEEDETLEVVAEVSTGQGCLMMLEEAQPQIIFLEFDIGGGMTLEHVIGEIKHLAPHAKIILVTDPRTQRKVADIMMRGAVNLIEKPYKKVRVHRAIYEAVNNVVS